MTVLNSKLRFFSLRSLAWLAFVGIVSSGQVAAENCPSINAEARQWLDKMSRSGNEVSYQGVVTFQRGDDMQVMQISHSVTTGTTSASLTQLTGQGAQVTRVDHPLDCVHPGHKLLRLNAQSLPQDSCGIAQYYRFRVAAGERVAGRKAVRIIITPRDPYRYGYVMELDKQTGLLLKAQTIGRGEKVLERFQFANLSYRVEGQQGEEAELVHRATHPLPSAVPVPDQSGDGHWLVGWLPGGFMPTDSPASASKRKTYTDGLAVFSVFLEVLPGEIHLGEGVVRRGGTTSYTRGMRLSDTPILITVIGEVPVNTARMVADSISWVTK